MGMPEPILAASARLEPHASQLSRVTRGRQRLSGACASRRSFAAAEALAQPAQPACLLLALTCTMMAKSGV
eukprot:6198633-Pleurochrysis_carterae.AAC.1